MRSWRRVRTAPGAPTGRPHAGPNEAPNYPSTQSDAEQQRTQLRGEVLGHAGVAGGPDEPHRRAGFDLVAYFG
jgi:hypothetical protein